MPGESERAGPVPVRNRPVQDQPTTNINKSPIERRASATRESAGWAAIGPSYCRPDAP